jgi:hypothetical protein
VSEPKEPFACTSVGVWKEVPEQGKGVAWSATRDVGTAASGYAGAENSTRCRGSHGGRLLMTLVVKAEVVRMDGIGRGGCIRLWGLGATKSVEERKRSSGRCRIALRMNEWRACIVHHGLMDRVRDGVCRIPQTSCAASSRSVNERQGASPDWHQGYPSLPSPLASTEY